MKTLFFTFLFSTLAFSGSAQEKILALQNQALYEMALGKFVRYYNSNQADSLSDLIHWEWDAAKLKKAQDDYGTILSYKYMGPLNDHIDMQGRVMVYFKVAFSKPAIFDEFMPSFAGKKVHAMSISIDEEHKIFGFSLLTSAPGLDSMMAKY